MFAISLTTLTALTALAALAALTALTGALTGALTTLIFCLLPKQTDTTVAFSL